MHSCLIEGKNMQALEKLKQLKNSTDLIEKQIAHILVENYEVDSFLRSKEIASQLNISKSVLTNFAKKIEYEGYTELYYRLVIEKRILF